MELRLLGPGTPYISRRHSMAFSMVTSSVYSMSLPSLADDFFNFAAADFSVSTRIHHAAIDDEGYSAPVEFAQIKHRLFS